MNRLPTILALVAVATGVSGCKVFAENCHEPQDYQRATSVPPLKVPEGLDAPPTRGALKIPDVPPGARARTAADPCLDESPSFFPNRPKPSAKPPAKGAAKADAPAAATPPAEPAKP
jgi:hypothetical protein